jgi:hypothetical protein
LRLRPSPEELKKWNKGCVEPHQTHVMKGWTEFLKELAPPGIFDDMREPEGKEQQERQRLLAQIYDLARKEEDYENGGIGSWFKHQVILSAFTNQLTDGDDVYYWPTNDAHDKSAARKKNRRSWDLLVEDSGTDSYADSAPPSKRSKKNSSATTPAGSPAGTQQRGASFDDSMQDCKPHMNADFLSDVHSVRSAAASPQGPWVSCTSAGDVKDLRLIQPMQGHAQNLQDASCMPQAYTHGSPWTNAPSPAPFNEPERQAISQAFAMDMPACTLPGRVFQWPHQNFEAQSQACPAYMTSQVPQPEFEDVSVTGLYTPSFPTHTPPVNLQHNPYLNGVYYCQPNGAQPFASPIPSPQLNNMPASNNVVVNVDPSFPCLPTTGPPEQCYTIDPSIYRHHPETGHSSGHHPQFRQGGPDFQAPARVERGFTGHGSGVGGGAHT